MEIIRTVDGLRRRVAEARAEGKSVGLVPTMGALHAGHISLVDRARKENNLVFTPVASPVNGGYYGFTMGCCF